MSSVCELVSKQAEVLAGGTYTYHDGHVVVQPEVDMMIL